jgi:hypothetical protein
MALTERVKDPGRESGVFRAMRENKIPAMRYG